MLFKSPDGYSVVTNQILELLDYKTILVCREVSPIWKKYIDEQRFWRVSRLLSLIKDFSFCEKFPEWRKIIPYIKTEMSGPDMDILIGTELYTNLVKDDLEDFFDLQCFEYDEERDQVKKWCPLHFAVYLGYFEFVEVMIRTPFDFNTLKFVFEDNFLSGKEKANCERCDRIRWENSNMCCGGGDMDEGFECVHDNSVLHQAARNGDIKMIKLILDYAEEKKININAKNKNDLSLNGQSAIVTAKDDPEVVKLLLKHCKYDRSDLGKLGLNTYAYMAESIMEKDEPPKKKMKTTKK